jgi:Cu(I)/Ag(I) efflux system membrane fusion protein
LISAQGELIEAFKIRESHPELLEAAKNKLRFWKISNAEINNIIKNQRVKEVFDIQAEHSGVIHKRRVNVGDHLMGGSVLFDLQNLNSLWAVFDVYEKDLGSVKVGDDISFTTPALTGQTFTSKVVFINPVINPATRTADVRLEVSNSKKMLKPDMFITGVLHNTNNENRDQLFVPKSAVLWTGERSVVYVKLPGTDIPSFEFREILLGMSYGKQYEVLEGVKKGEEVVTNGAFVIDASAQLNNRSSMMNRNFLGVKTTKSVISTPDYSKIVPSKFRLQLKGVLSAYLGMKDAFVASEDGDVKKFAKELKQKLNEVDMKLLKGEAHIYWMEKSKEMSGAIKQILSGKNIDAQRATFDELSVATISSAQAYGLYDEKLYVQYCPMANNDKGAYWLSKESQIRNPYFGDQMLTCGEVKDSIRERNKRTVNPAPMQGHNH